MNRRKSRENAFIVIFESFFLDMAAKNLINLSIEFENLRFDSYSKKLINGVLEHKEYLNKKIEPYLKNWELKRISPILLAILEISFFEIIFIDEIESPISINEAVELSKKYFNGDGPAFVNGVLGNLVKNLSENNK